MKRAELKVGEAYYYDRTSTWQERLGGTKAVVVDLERYEIVKQTWGRYRETPYLPSTKGTAVLVDLDRPIVRTAVPLGHLRGEYETTKAAIEKGIADRKAREGAFEEERRRRIDVTDRAVARAAALGLKTARLGSQYNTIRVAVLIDTEVLEKLLDAYAANRNSGEREKP